MITDPNGPHGHAVLLGRQEDLHITSNRLLHLPSLASDLRPKACKNLRRSRLKLAKHIKRVQYGRTEITKRKKIKKTTHQRQIISGRLPDLVGELRVEGIEVFDGDGDMVAVVH